MILANVDVMKISNALAMCLKNYLKKNANAKMDVPKTVIALVIIMKSAKKIIAIANVINKNIYLILKAQLL